MPNWVISKLTIQGCARELEHFKKIAKGKSESRDDEIIFDLNQFIPMPEHITAQDADIAQPTHPEAARIIPRWYVWQLRNWGCKWGICDPQLIQDGSNGGPLEYHFNTPWTIPIVALEEISRQFPKLKFSLSGFEYENQVFFRLYAANDDILVKTYDVYSDDIEYLIDPKKEEAAEADFLHLIEKMKVSVESVRNEQ